MSSTLMAPDAPYGGVTELDNEDLNSFKGIVFGLILVAPFWVAVAAIIHAL